MESGISNYKSGEYDRAILDFKKVIEIEPEYAKAYYNLGLTYYRNKEVYKAKESFEKAIYLKKDYIQAIYALAIVQEKLGKSDEAATLYKKIIKIDSEHPLAKEAREHLLKIEVEKEIPTTKIWDITIGAAVGYEDNFKRRSFTKIPIGDTISIVDFNVSVEPTLFDNTSLQIEFDHDSNFYLLTPSFTYHGNTIAISLIQRISDTLSFPVGVEYEVDDELAGVGYKSQLVTLGTVFYRLFIDTIKLKYEYQIEEFPLFSLSNAKSSNIIASISNKFGKTTYTKLSYSYRINNADGNNFSYIWHKVILGLNQKLSENIWFRLNYQHRIKNYTNVDSSAGIKRVDNGSFLTTKLSYDISKTMTFFVGFKYINNSSNISERSYIDRIFLSGTELNF